MEKSVQKIETAISNALDATAPELYADIFRDGVYLSGGGLSAQGLDKRLQDKFQIPFHVAEDPLYAVAKGTNIVLQNSNKFSQLFK